MWACVRNREGSEKDRIFAPDAPGARSARKLLPWFPCEPSRSLTNCTKAPCGSACVGIVFAEGPKRYARAPSACGTAPSVFAFIPIASRRCTSKKNREGSAAIRVTDFCRASIESRCSRAALVAPRVTPFDACAVGGCALADARVDAVAARFIRARLLLAMAPAAVVFAQTVARWRRRQRVAIGAADARALRPVRPELTCRSDVVDAVPRSRWLRRRRAARHEEERDEGDANALRSHAFVRIVTTKEKRRVEVDAPLRFSRCP